MTTSLVPAIRAGTAIAVTDGSYKDNMGTAAFTLRTSIEDLRSVTFAHMTPGMADDLSPYRAEVGGLFGIAAFLYRLHKAHDLQNGQITIACDCKGALERAAAKQPPNPKQPDFDLYGTMYQVRQKTPVTWHIKCVKGHQDEYIERNNLDPWAQVNIKMDLLAKAHWQTLDNQRPQPFPLPATDGVWSVWSHDQRITRWDSKTYDQLYFNTQARLYWAQKYEHFAVLDYDAIRMAYKSLNLYYQLRVPKWIGRRLPVGARIASWSTANISNCPRCGMTNESHNHVISCQHPGAIAAANQWLDKLELWLVREHTHPDLPFGIISLLRAGFRSTNWFPPSSSEPNIRRAFQQQQRLGCNDVMFGWWTTGWAEAQHLYLQSISRRTTGRRWLSRLIKKQWEISWDMWRHRLAIAATPDSFSLALEHEQANTEMHTLYVQLSRTDYPPLQRWFRQPINTLLHQPLAFKKDWIFMVRSFQDPTD